MCDEAFSLLELWDQLPQSKIDKLSSLEFLEHINHEELKLDFVVYEILEPNREYLIKYFGENIISIIGRDLTGEILQSCLSKDVWQKIAPAYEICIDWRSPVFFYSEADAPDSPYSRMDRLLLPFTCETQKVRELFTLVRFRTPTEVAAAYGLDQPATVDR